MIVWFIGAASAEAGRSISDFKAAPHAHNLDILALK